MSSAESHLGLLNSIVRSAERLCESKLCCLGHRRKVTALCLVCKIYHRVNHPMNGHLNHFVATRKTRASAALGDLSLVIPAAELTNSVGRFCLLLCICET